MKSKQRNLLMYLSSILLFSTLLMYIFKVNGTFQSALLIIATFIAGYPTFLKAWQSSKMKVFSIELLVTIAVIGALIIGEYTEAAVVTFLFLFGSFLEARTLEKARASLRSLLEMAPLEATVLRNGVRKVVLAEEVLKGDLVIVQSGEKVPVDGKVITGRASINESAITGESVPVSKDIDDEVFSSSIIDSGYIEVIAEKVGEDTTFSKIIELVEEAQEGKAKTQKFLERFANIYTPAIMVLSAIVWLITGDIHLSLTFLVIACPGALVISAPVSIVAGIGNGAKNGILIKGGEIMESLAKTNAIVFDKTGTLTKGRPEVTAIKSYGLTENELLLMAAEAEVISEHHLGRAIIKKAESIGLTLVNQPDEVMVLKGRGISVLLNGENLYIGNRKGLSQNEIFLEHEIEVYAIEQEKKGNTAVFVAGRDRVFGVISIADQIREEAASAIAQLRKSGIQQVVMLTGDNQYAANSVGQTLGIDQVLSELLPENKVEKIKAYMGEGMKLAMVGDGINDAPAIATANVGVAMGVAGTDVAMETADVVLMTDSLAKLAYAYKLSKATVRNMKQNMFLAIGTVFLLLIGVLTKNVNLASGMLVHELSVLLVIVNAVRLVRYPNLSLNLSSNLPSVMRYQPLGTSSCVSGAEGRCVKADS